MVKPIEGHMDNWQLHIVRQRRQSYTLPSMASLASIVNDPGTEPAPLLPGRSLASNPPPVLLAGSLRDISSLYREHLPPPPLQPFNVPPLSYEALSEDFASFQLAGSDDLRPPAGTARRASKRAYAGKDTTEQRRNRSSYAESAEAIQRKAEAHSTRLRERPAPGQSQRNQPAEQQQAGEQGMTPELEGFLHDITPNMPHITQQILLHTRQLHIQTLRSRIGKKAYSPEDGKAIKQALHHLMATENRQRLSALIKNKINHNPGLSTADKRVLLKQVRDNICAQKPVNTLIRRNSATTFSVRLQDFPAGLTEDFIFLLEKLGVTQAELSAYLYAATTAAAMIDHGIWGLIDDEIEIALKKEKLPEEQIVAMRDLATGFSLSLDKISPYLEPEMHYADDFILLRIRQERDDEYRDENLDFHRPLIEFRGLEANNIFTEEIKKNRELYILQFLYLQSAPLLELFKQAIEHDVSLLERSIINPEQYKLLLANDIRQMKTILTPQARDRLSMMLENTTVLPFIFGDPQRELPINSEEQRYGGRGLPLPLIFGWLTDVTLSPQQFETITRYLNYRLSEITRTGSVNIDWIRSLSAQTLERFLLQRTGASPGYDEYPMLMLYDAVNEIGKAVIAPHFDFQQLPEFIAWIRANAKFAANTEPAPSDDELACMMFQFVPDKKNSLSGIADNLRNNNGEEPGQESLAERASRGLRHFIKQNINDDSLSELRARGGYRDALTIRDELNNNVLPGRMLSFVAQRFNVTIIEENHEQNFQRYYDITGNTIENPPVNLDDAIIVRAGMLIPLDIDGTQQATILPERADNHNLLLELVRYLKRQEGIALSDSELNALIAALSHEILTNRKAQ